MVELAWPWLNPLKEHLWQSGGDGSHGIAREQSSGGGICLVVCPFKKMLHLILIVLLMRAFNFNLNNGMEMSETFPGGALSHEFNSINRATEIPTLQSRLTDLSPEIL